MPVGEERRALQLFNPGLDGRWATTNTMIAAVQILLPGETARAHRHTPTAIRFIMEGEGAYTAVDGERVYMAPGDLVLTPSWAWHDHGNETDHRVVWMDGLDVPLVQAVNAMFFQMYAERQVPLDKPNNASAGRHGHAGLNPTWIKERPRSSPLLLYSWAPDVGRAPGARGGAGDPHDGIALEYTHPHTGRALLPTMACWIQMLRPGRAPGRPSPHRQRRLLRGARRRGVDHRRLPLRVGPGRHHHAAVVGAPRARQPPAASPRCSSRSRTGPCWRRSASTARSRSRRATGTRRSPRRSAADRAARFSALAARRGRRPQPSAACSTAAP